MEAIKTPLTNAQMEILKLFSSDLSDSELAELKQTLLEFKLRRVVELADQAWDAQGWTQEKVEEILHTHLRTPYTSQKAPGEKGAGESGTR